MFMMRGGRSGTEEEPSEDYLLEGEYEKLKRSYRVMQNDYHRYKEDCQRMLKKQNYLLNMLGGEKDGIETDLTSMAQLVVKRRDEMNVQCLQELCLEHNDSKSEITEEMVNLNRIETQIEEVEKQIEEENKKMGGFHRMTAEHNRMQIQSVIFENRLQKSTVQFNTNLTLNRHLRDEIDHLRNERSLYGGLYKRLSKELQQAKEQLTLSIEISTQAFEQRDEAHNKMGALKERREKDLQTHNSEMKDLLRMISHDEKIKEFIQIKSNERGEYKQEKARRIQQRYEKRGPAADRILLDTYDVAFKNMCAVTKEKNIDVIIDNFHRKEEENFALYNYANELSSESDGLQAEISSLKASITEMSASDVNEGKKWEEMMHSVESKFQSKHRELLETEQRLTEINSSLDKLCQHVADIFESIGCDATPIRSQLGGESGISANNVTIYLAHIESRAMELLKSMYYLKMRKSAMEGVLPPKMDIGQLEPSLKIFPTVVPPTSFEDDALDDDDDVTPLAESELRSRVDSMLAKNPNIGMALMQDRSLSQAHKKSIKSARKSLK